MTTKMPTLTDLREAWPVKFGTHSAECWRWHYGCALAIALELASKERDARTTLADLRVAIIEAWEEEAEWPDSLAIALVHAETLTVDAPTQGRT